VAGSRPATRPELSPPHRHLSRHLPRHDATFQDLLESRSPGFDLLRLVLAFLVLVSHTWPLGGFGREPSSPLTPEILTLGGFAVAGFFAMSGMLVGRSALSRSPSAYVRARLVRIVPAYWTAIVFSAFVVAWIGWQHERGTIRGFVTLDPTGPVGYVVRAALFPVDFFHGVYDVFLTSTPFGRTAGSSFVNGSLWTLPYELRCYLVVGLLAVAAKRFGSRRTITAAWVLVGSFAVVRERRAGFVDATMGAYVDRVLVMLVFIFLTGAVVAVWADRIRLFGVVPVIAVVVGALAGVRSIFLAEHVSSASLAFFLPPIAAVLGPIGVWLRGIDLSYGTYLYAWPVQQLVAMWDLASGPWTFILVSGAVTLVLAAASWFLVEKPAMRRWSRRPRPVPSTPPTTLAA
jgi:peptidoglycan/LPS O-acetylase OafA/YrhL